MTGAEPVGSPPVGYRRSHDSPGYAAVYQRTYERGYYRRQWETIERPLLERVLEARGRAGARSMLDFACGTGRITEVGARIFPEVVGVDIAPGMLAAARRRLPGIRFLQSDLTREPFGERADVVTAFRFFLNAESSLRAAALAAFRRILRGPEARLVANVHVNAGSPLGIAYRARNAVRGRTVANVLSETNMRRVLGDNGFEIDEVHYYSLLPRLGWWFPGWWSALMEPAERLGRRTRWIARTAQCFLVVARPVAA